MVFANGGGFSQKSNGIPNFEGERNVFIAISPKISAYDLRSLARSRVSKDHSEFFFLPVSKLNTLIKTDMVDVVDPSWVVDSIDAGRAMPLFKK